MNRRCWLNKKIRGLNDLFWLDLWGAHLSRGRSQPPCLSHMSMAALILAFSASRDEEEAVRAAAGYLSRRARRRWIDSTTAALTPYVQPISPGKRVSFCILLNCSSENWRTSHNSRSLSGIQPNGSYRFCMELWLAFFLDHENIRAAHVLSCGKRMAMRRRIRENLTQNLNRSLLEPANYMRVGAMRLQPQYNSAFANMLACERSGKMTARESIH
jgi:hypothetical protein